MKKSDVRFQRKLKKLLSEGYEKNQALAIAYKMTGRDKSAREVDQSGFWEIKDNPISKEGVFDYAGWQVGDKENPDKIYKVYRPASELSKKETIDSFKLKPIIDEHTMLGKEGVPAEKKGVQGTSGEEVYFEDGLLYANLKIFSESLKTLIENGKQELSCGYTCTYEETSGIFEGEPYDIVMRDIIGNHIALVEKGRMGSEVRVLDESLNTLTEDNMEEILEELKKINSRLDKLEEAEEEEVENQDDDDMDDDDKGFGKDKKHAKDKKRAHDDDDDESEEKEKEEAKDDDDDDDDDEIEGKHAMDEALERKIIAKIASRDELARKLSKQIGTFDSASMTKEEVVAYGLKKLGLSAPKGQGEAMLNGYLAGQKVKVVDSAVMQPKSTGIDAYINGGK